MINNDRLRRWLIGLLAFLGPIALGALIINIGGFVVFWLICYFLMVLTPFFIIAYLVYKYIFQISAEKVEDRHRDSSDRFLLSLAERFDVIEEGIFDRSLRNRPRTIPKKPFDRLALLVSEKWHLLSEDQKQIKMSEIAGFLSEWIKEKGLERKGHKVRLDFYTDFSENFIDSYVSEINVSEGEAFSQKAVQE